MLKTLPRLWKTLESRNRRIVISLFLLNIVQGLLPALSLLVGRFVIDSVVLAASGHMPLRTIGNWVLAAFLIALLTQTTAYLQRLVTSSMRHRLVLSFTKECLLKCDNLDLSYYDDPAFHDTLEQVRRDSGEQAAAGLISLSNLCLQLTALTSTMALLFTLNWGIAILVMLFSAPALWHETTNSERRWKNVRQHSTPNRLSWYLSLLVTDGMHAKETKLLGLGPYLIGRVTELLSKIHSEEEAVEKRTLLGGAALSAASLVSYYSCYFLMALYTIRGALTLGELTVFAGAVRDGQTRIFGTLREIGQLYEYSLSVKNTFSFLKLKPRLVVTGMVTPPTRLSTGIRFEEVSFQYAGNPGLTLSSVSFTVLPGEKIALVGRNGTGKTTLVKLLTRLYDPTEGRITADGVDLREYDLDLWRQRCGVLLEDFTRYQLTYKENITYGNRGRDKDEEWIRSAAGKAGAEGDIELLRDGYETVLGRLWKGGQELSAGQWQRLALARTYFRDSLLIVLDEPTATLDPKAEYEVYRWVSNDSIGKTLFLISHRLAMARLADKILVLDGGRVIEQGSHDELMRRGGHYAQLYSFQAQLYD